MREKQKKLVKLSLNDLFFFNQYILGNGVVMNEKLHREMCDFVTSYRDWKGSKNKKLILEPRGSLKSTCVTIALPLQLMLKNPNIRILIDSEKLTNSKTFLHSIKGHMEATVKYRELSKLLHGKYPDPKSKKDEKWTSTEIITPLRTNRSIKEPTVATGGVDVVKVGQHYDVVIMDDPVSNNNCTTREQIEKVIQHYKLILSLLEPGGTLIIIGTRWDYGDLYGYLIENHHKYFDILVRKAINSDGHLLYPERLTKAFLDEQRASQDSYIFSCQYLNNPVPREDAVFKWDEYREWTGRFDNRKIIINELRKYIGETKFNVTEENTAALLNVFMTIDPATSLKEHADYTAIVVCGVDNKNRIFVIDYVNKRLSGQTFWDEIFRMQELYRPNRLGIETTAFQKSLEINFKDEMTRRNVFFHFDELKPDMDKFRRIKQLQPRYEAGQIFIRDKMPDLKYQMVNFPRTPHDDIVDALSYQLQIIYQKREHKEKTIKQDILYKDLGY